MPPRLLLTTDPDLATRQPILAGLQEYNRQQVPGESQLLAVLLLDEQDATIGGLWGRTYYDWLFVELLFVPEALRGQDLGARLLQEAEQAAKQRGCQHAHLDTFGFQAKDFYLKQGYTVFGQLENYPTGFTRYFLRKALV
ncbi:MULTISPECIES: GNAT family N-acetyltransferase [Hymenobacter]|uniref:GNAT family N-acetyltransferase n=2 Tax=Hymenobacter TaxID=89966 RepID=A0ABS6WV17_9BACT|nr:MULTISPECIES: GNAT family N-acetyltransferase [Hymenobacter]MBO3269568.1 GNAT family N-acetyltransferase [Hymenobacter defluvii]MBW3126926.1 GNAT family N-acetyltransferase [Hymenobacter profundi]MBW3127083.1 GNAT family N-acetyltransferase [Hymenobacter profundi]